MYTIAAVILFSAILVFFSSEFGQLLKKLFAIRGVKLFLPLTLVSVVMIYSEDWLLWGLLYLKIGLHSSVFWLASILPLHTQQQNLATLLLIYSITLIPITLFYFQKKKRPFFYNPRQWIITAFIWELIVITLMVSLY